MDGQTYLRRSRLCGAGIGKEGRRSRPLAGDMHVQEGFMEKHLPQMAILLAHMQHDNLGVEKRLKCVEHSVWSHAHAFL